MSTTTYSGQQTSGYLPYASAWNRGMYTKVCKVRSLSLETKKTWAMTTQCVVLQERAAQVEWEQSKGSETTPQK